MRVVSWVMLLVLVGLAPASQVWSVDETATAAVNPLDVVLRNDFGQVTLTSEKAAIKRFQVFDSKPIELKDWQRIGEQNPESLEEPLAVLDAFHWRFPHHSWLRDLTDSNLARKEPWRVAASDTSSVIFETESVDNRVLYRVTYTMERDKPTVSVKYVTENISADQVTIDPILVGVNGVHKDLAPVEDYDSGAFYIEGAGESLDYFDVPGTPEKAQTSTSGETVDVGSYPFVAIKSRFFASVIKVEPAALADSESGNAEFAAMVGGNSTGGTVLMNPITYNAGTDDFPIGQTMFTFNWMNNGQRKFDLKPDASLTLNWSITATSLKKDALALLGDDVARIEYSDWGYRFFKILANFFTYVLGAVYGFYTMVGFGGLAGGFAVITTTFLVKAALHRMTFKQQKSMMMMQKLGPDMKALQEKYKDNRQELAKKQMELWKKHGVNPMGGCLPIFLMMPIFIGLYNAFRHAADLRGTSFLWINDLTLPDQLMSLGFHWPFFGGMATLNVLPLIYVAISLYMGMQMKVPENAEQMQKDMAKMMRFLPAVFGIIFYNMPSGLVLYFTVQALLSAIETKYIRNKLGMN